MSVFKVQLQNTQEGLMDINPVTGLPFTTSIQRTIYVTGPKLIYRKLNDGQTFTDCNYWKKFAYPQVPFSQAFIAVVSDDGSVYSDIAQENNYALIFGGDTAYTVATTSTFANKYIDLIGTYGSYATYIELQNLGTTGATQDIKVQFNGSSSAIMTLFHNTTQVFNQNDLLVSKIAFQGGSADTTLQIILSVRSPMNS